MDLDADTILFYYKDYLRLLKMGWLVKIYRSEGRFFYILLFIQENKKRGLEQTGHNLIGEKSTATERNGAPSQTI